MTTTDNAPRFTNLSLRKAALIAGLGLLLMTILSPIAYLNTFQKLVNFDDAALTAQNIMNSIGAFRASVIMLFTVAILDLVVAWALYILLVPTNKNFSALAALFRVIYAGIFIFAVSKLYIALQVLSVDGLESMVNLQAFQTIWDMALILFGFHLLIVGYLAIKSGYIPTWLGVLLVLAAVGYVVDGLGEFIFPNYNLGIAQFTFIGEVVLIIWLLWRGFKGVAQTIEDGK